MVKRKLKSFARKIVLFMLPNVAPLLIFIFILGNILTPITTIMHAIKDGVRGVWEVLFESEWYEDEPRERWNADPEDPDMTALFYQRLLDERKQIDILTEDGTNYTIEAETYLNKRSSDSMEGEEEETITLWYDVMRNEHTLLAPEDMIYLVGECYKRNEHMFEMNGIYYEYLKHHPEIAPEWWGVVWDYDENDIATGVLHDYLNTSYKPVEAHDDHIYKQLSRTKIEGEEHPDHPGVRRFAMHWPDAVSLATFYSTENWENWGTDEDAEYIPSEKTMGINSVDDYYLTDNQLRDVLDLYQYHFDYYWDGVEDKWHSQMPENAWRYKFGFRHGVNKIGYRFRMVPGDYEVFVPESAPQYIYNSWESYTYVYTPTSNVPNYCPEGYEWPQTEPPPGMYCCGRWQVIDPYFYIEEVAAMCPWYRERIDYGVPDTYDWVHEMIDRINVYIDLLPTTAAYNRSKDFDELADLYVDKKVKVVYEGTKCAEMDEYIANLEAWLAEERPDWELEIDIESKALDEFVEVDDNLDCVPFSSYGVTYASSTSTEMYKRSAKSERRLINGQGDVWISWDTGGYRGIEEHVHDWLHLYDGADEPLNVPTYYSKEQVFALLKYFEELSGGKIPFTDATDAIYAYNKRTGIDLAAVMAIWITEGSYKGSYGQVYYNVFNIKGTPSIPGTEFKDYRDVGLGQALIEGMDLVLAFWGRGQNTFYKMQFNQYGYPQNEEEAEASKGGIFNSYCPWYDDVGYVTTDYDSRYIWCNKNGAQWIKLREIAGMPVAITPKEGRGGGGIGGGEITIDLDGVTISLYPSDFMTYEELLAATANPDYYLNFAKCVEIDGRLYFYEIQSTGNTAWSLWGPKKAGGNQIDSTGCFWYAVASAVSAKTGKCYTIEDIVRNHYPGAVISVDSNGKFQVTDSSGREIQEPANQGRGTAGGPADAQRLLNEAGINASAKNIAINDNSMTQMAKGLTEGKSYIYYYNWSRGGGKVSQHWVSINGVTSNGELVVTGDLGEGAKKIKRLSDLTNNVGSISLMEITYD